VASASFDSVGSSSEDEGIDELKPMKIDIDLGLSAYANARKYAFALFLAISFIAVCTC
jgi:hypothetical protein